MKDYSRKKNSLLIKLKKYTTSEGIINLVILLLIYWYLLSFFNITLLLSTTTTTGGDMSSHYYTAQYLHDYLLPHGKIIGWTPNWYAGFPMQQFYMPLPFILISLLGYLIPLQVSFKLITVAGIFLLPLTTFLSMRLFEFKVPTPIISAAFTLIFLFNESYSMWGGNIPSNLAGEFCFTLGLAIMPLYTGLL